MYSRKPIDEKKLIDEAIYNLSCIGSYQNKINSYLDDSGIALGELNDILEDFPRDFNESTEKLNALLDAAYRLENWAIAHHQNIRQLGAILKQIEETQGSNLGGAK